MARQGAKVYLGARDESKATAALAKLEQEGLGPGNGQVLWLKVDYSDPRLAKKAAEEFLERELRLDILGMQLSTNPWISSNALISTVNNAAQFVIIMTTLQRFL